MGIYEFIIYGTRVVERVADSLFAYFIEFYSLCVVAQPQNLFQVPTYRFAFAVGVGCEINFIGFVDFFLQAFYNRFFIGGNNVVGGEIFTYVYAHAFFRQVADVSAARVDFILSAEIFFDRLRLGRRFDYNKLHTYLRYLVISYSEPFLTIAPFNSSIDMATEIS